MSPRARRGVTVANNNNRDTRPSSVVTETGQPSWPDRGRALTAYSAASLFKPAISLLLGRPPRAACINGGQQQRCNVVEHHESARKPRRLAHHSSCPHGRDGTVVTRSIITRVVVVGSTRYHASHLLANTPSSSASRNVLHQRGIIFNK